MVKLASCQYAITLYPNWSAYEGALRALCADAAVNGAELLLLPEYAGMELAGLLQEDQRGDLQASIAGIQALLPDYLGMCESIAREHALLFCPGSLPVRDDDGLYRNRAYLFGPDGRIGHQDKIMMTRFERERWFIAAGREGVHSFDTPIGRIGIQICYDIEFPAAARKLAEQGCDLILTPSCTDTEAGYHRVRIGAQARALENQMPVLVAPTAGFAPWSVAVDENFGRAALYVPADEGMPSNGIVAESAAVFASISQWLYCDIDLAEVRRLRTQGRVMLYRDWPEQYLLS